MPAHRARARRSLRRRGARLGRDALRACRRAPTIVAARRPFSRRARSTHCLRRWRSIPTRSCSPAAPIWACASARIARLFPAVIALEPSRICGTSTIGADALELGGAVTYTEALAHLDRHFPSFAALVRRIGSRQIRNLGTIAGNLATASPIGDTIPCLIALDATVTLASRSGRARRCRSKSSSPATARPRSRRARSSRRSAFPSLRRGQEFSVYKLSKRFDQDISTVIAAFRLERRRRQGRRVARGLWRHGGARDARRESRGGCQRPAMDAGTGSADIEALLCARLHADRRPSRRRRLSPARRRQPLRRFQFETSSDAPVRVEAL